MDRKQTIKKPWHNQDVWIITWNISNQGNISPSLHQFDSQVFEEKMSGLAMSISTNQTKTPGLSKSSSSVPNLIMQKL